MAAEARSTSNMLCILRNGTHSSLFFKVKHTRVYHKEWNILVLVLRSGTHFCLLQQMEHTRDCLKKWNVLLFNFKRNGTRSCFLCYEMEHTRVLLLLLLLLLCFLCYQMGHTRFMIANKQTKNYSPFLPLISFSSAAPVPHHGRITPIYLLFFLCYEMEYIRVVSEVEHTRACLEK